MPIKPFIEAEPQRTTTQPTTGGIDISQIKPFLQGVSINNTTVNQLRVLPQINTNLNDKNTQQNVFGQLENFSYPDLTNTPATDQEKFTGLAYLTSPELFDTDNLGQPITIDGSISPFDVKDIPLGTIDVEKTHGIKGQITTNIKSIDEQKNYEASGTILSKSLLKAGTDATNIEISKYHSQDITYEPIIFSSNFEVYFSNTTQQNKTVEYFLDEGNDDVLLSNYINTEQNQINDYSDNMLQQRFTYHDIELDKKLAELNPRPIEKILIGPTEKSATAGFDYYMTYQGTDSIAYGDRYNSHKSTVNGQRYTRAKFENVLLQGDMFSQVSRYYPATGFYIGVNFVDYQNDLINLNKKRASFWNYAGGGS